MHPLRWSGVAVLVAVLGVGVGACGDDDGGGDADGVQIVTADFEIMAGGWGFDVVSVQARGESATVYVTSYAD